MALENIISDLADLLGFGGAGGAGFAIWQSKANKEAVKRLDERVDDIAISVAMGYTREELNARFDKLDESLNRIHDKIDRKADKR